MVTGKKAGVSAISEQRASDRVPTLALLLIAAVSVLWGLNWPAMRAAVVELSPWTFRTICVVVAGAGLLGIAAMGREPVWPRRDAWLRIAVLGLFGVTGWQMLSAMALQHIGGGHGAIIAYTMPVWAALVSAYWLRERITPRKVASLALGVGGMLILFGRDLGDLGSAPLGTALMLGAAFCWAINTVMIKVYPWGIGVIALSGWQLVLGGVPILLAWLWIEPDPDLSQLTWKGLLAVGYASTVALIFCYTAFIKIVTMLPATVAAISTLAIPVFGVLFSALLLGEPVGVAEIAALVLVTAALTLALVPMRRA
jgi:drug/metabolite transporter (DMT)-like permease